MADYNPRFVFSRNLGHKSMKMYGEGFGSLEEKITAESAGLMQRLRDTDSVPSPVRTLMGKWPHSFIKNKNKIIDIANKRNTEIYCWYFLACPKLYQSFSQLLPQQHSFAA